MPAPRLSTRLSSLSVTIESLTGDTISTDEALRTLIRCWLSGSTGSVCSCFWVIELNAVDYGWEH